MDRGGGRMNPPQLLGSPKLLRVELPSNQNLGIRNFMGKIVQIGKLREMMFGELVLQPRTKPVRRVPQFKAVMNGEKDFQRELKMFHLSSDKRIHHIRQLLIR